jgi:hypothetical protein
VGQQGTLAVTRSGAKKTGSADPQRVLPRIGGVGGGAALPVGLSFVGRVEPCAGFAILRQTSVRRCQAGAGSPGRLFFPRGRQRAPQGR